MINRVGDKSTGRFLPVAFQTRYKEVLVKAHTAASGAVLRLQIAPVLGRKRKPIEWSEFQVLFLLTIIQA